MLRDYGRARGLCFRCGEKWSRDHRCPEAIQLHALQELREDLEHLRQQFPRATVWSRLGAQGRGDVMAQDAEPHLASEEEAAAHGPGRT